MSKTSRKQNSNLETQQAQQQVSKLQEEKEATEQVCQELRAENDDLKIQLSQAREEIAAPQEAYIADEQTRQEVEEENQRLKAKQNDLEQEVKADKDTEKKLKRKLRDREKTIKKLKEKIKTSQTEQEQLIAEHKEVQARFKECSKERDAARSAQVVLELEGEQLKAQLSVERQKMQVDVAQRLSDILSDVSSLSGMEPQEVKGLTPKSIHNALLDWFENTLGERPEPFPTHRDGLEEGNMIWLDADEVDLEVLLARYNWSPEKPFDGSQTGKRRLQFRLVRRGWRTSNLILRRAIVMPILPKREEETNG